MHGSTGDLILLGTVTDELEPIFSELTQEGFDLGGSGSDMRTPSCCCGPARCEWAMFDTLRVTYDLTMHYQDELHRPYFPYKFKIKVAGCPNDCVASIARADMSIIGIWRDDIRIDQDKVLWYAKAKGLDIDRNVIRRCPTNCMDWDGKELKIDNRNCSRCMHCINAMPLALKPGKDRGAAILIGAKAPIVAGAILSSVLVPFMRMDPPYSEDEPNYNDLIELIDAIWEFWGEEGKGPRAHRRIHPARRPGEFPGSDRARTPAGNGRASARESVRVLLGAKGSGIAEYPRRPKAAPRMQKERVMATQTIGPTYRYRSSALSAILAADHQGELREMGPPRDSRARRHGARGRIGRQALHRARRIAATAVRLPSCASSAILPTNTATAISGSPAGTISSS